MIIKREICWWEKVKETSVSCFIEVWGEDRHTDGTAEKDIREERHHDERKPIGSEVRGMRDENAGFM